MPGRATRIDLFDTSTTPMRVFHLAWMAFFVRFSAEHKSAERQAYAAALDARVTGLVAAPALR